MRNVLIILFIAFAITLAGCGKAIDESFQPVENNTWAFSKPVKVEMGVNEPGQYKMYVNVRMNDDYPYSNIWMKIFVTTEKGDTIARDRYHFPLMNEAGRWIGRGPGKTIDTRFEVATLNLKEAGKYNFILKHDMRIDSLPGIEELGIRLKQN